MVDMDRSDELPWCWHYSADSEIAWRARAPLAMPAVLAATLNNGGCCVAAGSCWHGGITHHALARAHGAACACLRLARRSRLLPAARAQRPPRCS